MIIKEIDVINIHYGRDGETQTWVKLRDMQEMAIDPLLDDLPELIEMLRHARNNPGLQDCIDRAKIMYRLGKP
jgi:hypothetical protein